MVVMRTPRGPHSRSSAAPLYFDLRSREGGRPGVGWALGGPQGGLLCGRVGFREISLRILRYCLVGAVVVRVSVLECLMDGFDDVIQIGEHLLIVESQYGDA